jgi:MFS family permease
MEQASASPSNIGAVWRLCGATALIVLANALAYPVLAVRLQQLGYSTGTVGFFAMIPWLLVGLLIQAMPRLITRWGLVRSYQWGCLLELAGGLGYVLGDGLAVWACASVAAGVGAAALWNAAEALLAQEAPVAYRGRAMGLYQTSLGAALAIGPLMPAALGWEARQMLWLSAAVLVLCVAVALTTRRETAATAANGHAGGWKALRGMPILAGIAFASGVFEIGLSSVIAAHMSAKGLSLGAAASVAGAIGVGSFLCQYPAGWAADKFKPAAVFSAAGWLLLAGCAVCAFADLAPWLLWVAGAIWGGVGGALYTLAMVRVAHDFAGKGAAIGAAATIAGYTWGGAIGPVASGLTVERAGLTGLSVLLGAIALGTLLGARKLVK